MQREFRRISLIYTMTFLIAVFPALLFGQTVGSLVMSGDDKFDCDSIANCDSNQWRWLSYPGARLTLNAADRGYVIPPMAADLPLNLGGYLGRGIFKFANVVNLRVLNSGEDDLKTGLSESRATTWYPYKLTFAASFPHGNTMSGYDFFVDANSTVVRVVRLNASEKREICFSGSVNGTGGAHWDDTSHVLLVSDTKYWYGLRFVGLKGDSLTAFELPQTPRINSKSWSLRVPVAPNGASFAVSFGFATASEGAPTAIARAKSAFSRPVTDSLADTKATFDGCLRKVAKPTRWGIDGIDASGVTAEQHRRAYYAAWAFLIQDVMDVFPENHDYPYSQVGVGKPSLWWGGEATAPGTCSWESLLGYQWVSFIHPDVAWKSYEGLMSRVTAEGKLGGESLPSRKAQTAWILYRISKDRARLERNYPAIKRYLLWREREPRWIVPSYHDYGDERDMEYVVSWLVDVDYAGRIATELGLVEDARLWQNKTGPMMEQMRNWFFNEPEKIHQFCFVEKNVHFAHSRTKDEPIYIATALGVKNLPPEMLARVKNFFMSIHAPDRSNDGFPYTKYPDNNLVAYGLIDHGMKQAKSFVQALLRDAIRVGEFTEDIHTGPEAFGVKPSLFTAMNIIEFTWMLNGVRYDSGTPTAFAFP